MVRILKRIDFVYLAPAITPFAILFISNELFDLTSYQFVKGLIAAVASSVFIDFYWLKKRGIINSPFSWKMIFSAPRIDHFKELFLK